MFYPEKKTSLKKVGVVGPKLLGENKDGLGVGTLKLAGEVMEGLGEDAIVAWRLLQLWNLVGGTNRWWLFPGQRC